MYYRNYLAHHTKKDGVWFCNGSPISKDSLKKTLKSATPSERKKIKETVEKEKLKKEIREHPKKLYQYRDKFTKDEIEQIISQINWDRRISDVAAEERARNVEKLLRVVKNTANVANDVSRTVKAINDIRRIFSGDSESDGDKKKKNNSDGDDQQKKNQESKPPAAATDNNGSNGHKKKPHR